MNTDLLDEYRPLIRFLDTTEDLVNQLRLTLTLVLKRLDTIFDKLLKKK